MKNKKVVLFFHKYDIFQYHILHNRVLYSTSALQGIVMKSVKELKELIRVNEGGITEQAIGQMLRTRVLNFIGRGPAVLE